MATRVMSVGRFSFLEWGEATSEPRSSVRDKAGTMIFSGSPIVSRHSTRCGRVGRLLDSQTVAVRWADQPDDGGPGVPTLAKDVVVTGPFERPDGLLDQRSDWAAR